MQKDHEHSQPFLIIVVFYMVYIREVDYIRLNRNVTPSNYHTIRNIGCNRRKIRYRHHAYTILSTNP
jgi:hypothetical protein